MTATAAAAWRTLRAARGRSLLAALGIALASAMAGAAVTVAYGLSTGFDRAARQAGLPDVVVRFADQPQSRIDGIVRRLPDLEARAYRLELRGVDVAAGYEISHRGVVQAVDGPRRGYAIVAGRDVGGRPREAVVERGLARAWHLRSGAEIDVGRFGPLRVVGIAVSPDNVAFPLTSTPRVYVSRRWLERDVAGGRLPVNQALIWARNRRDVDVLLQQARATSIPIAGVRFITRDGVRVLIDGAAGVVVALLVAFSLVALVAAAIMLGAGTRGEVARRLPAIGVQRAVGVSRGSVAAQWALGAGTVGLLAGAAGLAAGALLAGGPSGRLLEALDEQPPGAALLVPLGGALIAIVALVAGAAPIVGFDG
ncbi:MAG: FtsX-like permease family protein, partial [Solirubrobacterales bacterium]|nr:FtsX-like permease family protein [Solirubrobacterales bacterium]